MTTVLILTTCLLAVLVLALSPLARSDATWRPRARRPSRAAQRQAERDHLEMLRQANADRKADTDTWFADLVYRGVIRDQTAAYVKAFAPTRERLAIEPAREIVPVHAFVPGEFINDGDPFGERAPERPVPADLAGDAACSEPAQAAGTGLPPDEVDWDPDREGPNLCNGCLEGNHCDGGASFCECTCGLPEDWADAIEPTRVLPPVDVMAAELAPHVAEALLGQMAAEADCTFVRQLLTVPLGEVARQFDRPLALTAGVG